MAHWSCCGLLELLWLIVAVVAHWSCGGLFEPQWLIGAMVAHWCYSSSLELLWLFGAVVAHLSYSGSLVLWWLIGHRSTTHLVMGYLPLVSDLLGSFASKNSMYLHFKTLHC